MVIFLGIVCFFLIVVGIVVNSTERPAAALEVESPPAETSDLPQVLREEGRGPH